MSHTIKPTITCLYGKKLPISFKIKTQLPQLHGPLDPGLPDGHGPPLPHPQGPPAVGDQKSQRTSTHG